MNKKKIGLALGSGAARGWAHLGVLSVLKELSVPVHCVAGTSIGALVGGFYAAGRLDALYDVALHLDWKKSISYFLEMNIPRSGLIDGKKVVDFVKEHVRDADIEDMDVLFSAVAVDVLTGDEVVMSHGGLIEAIRASISIPGIFTPVPKDNLVLVDGGIVNPVPVDVAGKMGANAIIAIDLNHGRSGAERGQDMEGAQKSVSSPEGLNFISEVHRKILSTINEQLDRMDPDKLTFIRKWMVMQELPNIFDVIGNSIRIMEKEITASRLKRDKPDILIRPDLSDIGFMEFHKAEQCMREGRRAALEKKDEILDLIN